MEQPPGGHQVAAQVVARPVVASSLPPTISSSATENVAVVENQLIHVLDELEARESSGRRLEAEVATMGKKLAAAKHQVGLPHLSHSLSLSITGGLTLHRPPRADGWVAGGESEAESRSH